MIAARPECSISWDAELKLKFILMSPAGLIGLIVLYLTFKVACHKKKASLATLMRSAVTLFVGGFVVCSTFFLKGVLSGYDCTVDPITNQRFLDTQPDIECESVGTVPPKTDLARAQSSVCKGSASIFAVWKQKCLNDLCVLIDHRRHWE